MDQEQEFHRKLEEVEKALRKVFGGKPGTFEDALRRAGRRLPRGARRAGEEVIAAQQLAGHPGLRMRIDWAKVNRSLDRVRDSLKGVDLKDRRKGFVIGALASLAFNLILLFVLILVVARWRGWI